MLRIAIVEDEESAQNTLCEYIKRYYDGDDSKYGITVYDRAELVLNNYRTGYDIIFMDVKLPGMDGMQLSREIRKLDSAVMIIFVTNLAQFAVKGYEVSAFDFVVKPVGYSDFALKFKRAETTIENKRDIDITVSERYKTTRLSSGEILYVEVVGHYLYYHTQSETIKGYGSISELEKTLAPKCFMRCNNCYLVNPRFIKCVEGYTVVMKNGDELLISHQRKKAFMTELTVWLGEGKNL